LAVAAVEMQNSVVKYFRRCA